jgi:imidazolonepropionase-like amidohydrolase
MKLFKTSLIALALFSTVSQAASIAITNATIYTATAKGILSNATVVIENDKIIAINPETINADSIFDAKGKILTPGLISSMNHLGLVEVNAVKSTRDAGDKKADITFDPSIAFNPMSTAISYARKGGITRSLVIPSGGDSIFKGQSFETDLSGSFNSVTNANNGLYVSLGAKSKGSRAFDLQKLIHTLEDAADKLAKAKDEKKDKKADKDKKKAEKTIKRSDKVIDEVLAGNKLLIVDADRATDLLALIALKKRFSLDLVITGAADAILVADKLVEANIPVIIDAMRNLPGSFDSLHTSLTSAADLTQLGVKVGFIAKDAHNIYQLRFDAGNAIANGLSRQDALAAVTANIADIFHINAGTIAKGKQADLVLWSADPFEISSKVETMWINGIEK